MLKKSVFVAGAIETIGWLVVTLGVLVTLIFGLTYDCATFNGALDPFGVLRGAVPACDNTGPRVMIFIVGLIITGVWSLQLFWFSFVLQLLARQVELSEAQLTSVSSRPPLSRRTRERPARVRSARGDVETLLSRGEVAADASDWLAASGLARQALAIDPSSVSALLLAAEADIGVGEFEPAARSLGDILRIVPEHTEALLMAARSPASAAIGWECARTRRPCFDSLLTTRKRCYS